MDQGRRKIFKAQSLMQANRIFDPLAAAGLLVLIHGAVAPRLSAKVLPELAVLALLAGTLAAVFLHLAEAYRPWLPSEFPRELNRVTAGVLLTYAALLLAGFLLHATQDFSRAGLAGWMLAWPLALFVERWTLKRLRRRIRGEAEAERTVVVAGIGELGGRLACWIDENPWSGMSLAGFFDDRLAPAPGGQGRLGGLDDLPGYVREHNVDAVYIALPMRAEARVRDLLEQLADSTAAVYFFPDISLFDMLLGAGVTNVGGYPALALRESPFRGASALLKRLEDAALSCAILVLASPLLGLIALAVRLDSPGPIIFRQWRYGLGGRPIEVYKFRTMRVTEDGYEFKAATADDPRVTRVGRFLRNNSLDELPQFVNVLQGSMSIVGPRPHAVAMNEEYRGLVSGYMLRHVSKPGITGLAQVEGLHGEIRSVEEMRRRIQLDMEYLQHWSVFLDLRIILRTFFTRAWRRRGNPQGKEAA
ncbi:MAG: undecaprenyl-phosphate glucose phosphotransferase [Desulfovibrionaceae bacterium]